MGLYQLTAPQVGGNVGNPTDYIQAGNQNMQIAMNSAGSIFDMYQKEQARKDLAAEKLAERADRAAERAEAKAERDQDRADKQARYKVEDFRVEKADAEKARTSDIITSLNRDMSNDGMSTTMTTEQIAALTAQGAKYVGDQNSAYADTATADMYNKFVEQNKANTAHAIKYGKELNSTSYAQAPVLSDGKTIVEADPLIYSSQKEKLLKPMTQDYGMSLYSKSPKSSLESLASKYKTDTGLEMGAEIQKEIKQAKKDDAAEKRADATLAIAQANLGISQQELALKKKTAKTEKTPKIEYQSGILLEKTNKDGTKTYAQIPEGTNPATGYDKATGTTYKIVDKTSSFDPSKTVDGFSKKIMDNMKLFDTGDSLFGMTARDQGNYSRKAGRMIETAKANKYTNKEIEEMLEAATFASNIGGDFSESSFDDAINRVREDIIKRRTDKQ